MAYGLLNRALTWLRAPSRRRLVLDTLVIFGAALALRLATYHHDLFEKLVAFSRKHESWELDEAFIGLAILSVALIVFGLRRIQDQRRELKLRLSAERRAASLAYHDPLTGLPNRRRFREAVSMLSSRGDKVDAVTLIDLDGFTPVNDSMGQEGGDETLRIIAQRLRNLCTRCTMVARVGGDEFALLVEDLAGPEDVERLAQDVLAEVGKPVGISGEDYMLRVSVGVAAIDCSTSSGESALRHANLALRRAKKSQRSSYVLYDATVDTAQRERMHIEHDLRRGLKQGQIVPYYQPIVDLVSEKVVKLEALARWNHPTQGAIAPFMFVPIAEERGMIAELTETILHQACIDALTWPRPVMVSVNLSPALLDDPAYALRLVGLLSETGLPPYRLELEITEHALEADLNAVRRFIDQLRSLGVRTALDDFGTGYSSLSRLQSLQFDELKIDRSFVQGIATQESAAIVRSIIQLGSGLGMALTAEGIETAEQHEWLVAQGCQHGQGYLFGKPTPAAGVAQLLEQTGTTRKHSRRRLARKVA